MRMRWWPFSRTGPCSSSNTSFFTSVGCAPSHFFMSGVSCGLSPCSPIFRFFSCGGVEASKSKKSMLQDACLTYTWAPCWCAPHVGGNPTTRLISACQVSRMTVITHSSIAILLICLMKPNVLELHAPISKVAMLGCYRDVVNLCACGCFLFHFA